MCRDLAPVGGEGDALAKYTFDVFTGDVRDAGTVRQTADLTLRHVSEFKAVVPLTSQSELALS